MVHVQAADRDNQKSLHVQSKCESGVFTMFQRSTTEHPRFISLFLSLIDPLSATGPQRTTRSQSTQSAAGASKLQPIVHVDGESCRPMPEEY